MKNAAIYSSEIRGLYLMKCSSEKSAIFLEYENPQFFSFFISCYFSFSPNEYPGLCRHRPGHLLGKIRLHNHEIENEKKLRVVSFRISKIKIFLGKQFEAV